VQIAIALPDVKLGVLEAAQVRVEAVHEELARETDAACARVRQRMTVEQVAEHPPVRATRNLFRAWRLDPARYRPSSEALLRRVVQGKGLYRVSTAVDVINLGSLETGWPYGAYDLARIEPPVTFRHGVAGETYDGIGKHAWHLEGKPVLADAQGPFGMPISDSTRTMITEQTTSVLTVVFAPAGAEVEAVQTALDTLADRFSRYCEGSGFRAAIVLP
jgi:DNA/RNA-binding domain of Phe-tRNA-synthetase-like protein